MVHRAIGFLQIDDCQVEQALHFLIRELLCVVVEGEARLVEGLLDDEFTVHVGDFKPAPRFDGVTHAQEVPPLLGFGFRYEVDQVLANGPVHVTPQLPAVVRGRPIVTHPIPYAGRGAAVGERPVLGVAPYKAPIVLL